MAGKVDSTVLCLCRLVYVVRLDVALHYVDSKHFIHVMCLFFIRNNLTYFKLTDEYYA